MVLKSGIKYPESAAIPNKQHLPLKITQNFTVQWAEFWATLADPTCRSEFMLKKHSTLQKVRLSIELTQY